MQDGRLTFLLTFLTGGHEKRLTFLLTFSKRGQDGRLTLLLTFVKSAGWAIDLFTDVFKERA